VKISFAVNLAPGEPLLSREDTGRFSDLVKMAEDYGAEAVGTYDSAFVGGDVQSNGHSAGVIQGAHWFAAHQSSDSRTAGDGLISGITG